jgi:hypothetical protein
MRGKILIIVLGLLSMVFVANLVSAQGNAPYFIQEVIDNTEEILSPIAGALLNTDVDEYLFARVLLAIILFFLVRIGLESIPALSGKKGVSIIVAFAVAALSVRYLGEIGIVKGIILPYSVLGIALTTILPFLIYFFFVHKVIENGVGRRIAWILYLIILFVLWLYRYDEVSTVGNWIYFIIVTLAILLLIFDKSVRRYFSMAGIRKAQEGIDTENIAKALKNYREMTQMYSDTGDKRFLRKAERYDKYLKEVGVRTR